MSAPINRSNSRDPYVQKFKELDANKDRRLSKDEFVGDVSADWVEEYRQMFDRLDLSGDGTLSLKEFRAPFGEHRESSSFEKFRDKLAMKSIDLAGRVIHFFSRKG